MVRDTYSERVLQSGVYRNDPGTGQVPLEKRQQSKTKESDSHRSVGCVGKKEIGKREQRSMGSTTCDRSYMNW